MSKRLPPPHEKIMELVDHLEHKRLSDHGRLKEKLNKRYGWDAVNVAMKAERQRRRVEKERTRRRPMHIVSA